jgi:hypothetical protein
MELQKVLVIDPQTNVEETYRTKEVVYKSNVNKSLYKYNADSYSNTNVIFNNITPPSLNTIIPRSFKIKYTLTVSVVGNGQVPPVYAAAVDIAGDSSVPADNISLNLCDSPLQQSCSAIELRINGSATSISPNDWIMTYSHMVDNKNLNGNLSVVTHQKDTSPLYNGWTDDNTSYNNRSVFAPYGANTTYPSNSSTIWVKTQVAASTNAWTDVYNVTVMESLYISPAVWGEMEDKVSGFSNINNFTLNFRISNLNRAVRCQSALDAGYVADLTSINVTGFNEAPELELTYITPDPVLAAKMPSVLAFDYSYIQPFITSKTYNSSNPSTIGLQVMNSIRLPSIPKRIMIYAKPSKRLLAGQYLNTIPDIFLPITNLSITFNNRINLLANDNAYTLYQKSVANGLTDTFQDWQYYTGSVMIIDVAKDLGLDADEVAGQSNKYSTLQISATFSNANVALAGCEGPLLDANNYDYYVTVESPGKAFITPSDCQFVLTGPSSAEVLALTSSLDSVADYSDLESKQVGGGAFGIGKLFKSGLNIVKNLKPEQVVKGLELAQKGLSALGMGVAGGAMKHKRVY